MIAQLTTPEAPNTRGGCSRGDSDHLLLALKQLPAGSPQRHRIRAQVVVENLSLAAALARRYPGGRESYEDLRQVACLALVKAVDRYDARRGRFRAYARATILGELRHHFRDCAWALWVPRSIKDHHHELGQATADFTQRHGRTPKLEELAEHLGVSQEETSRLLVADGAFAPRSLNSEIKPGGDGSEQQDLLGHPDPQLEQITDKVAVRHLMARLPDRERRILILRFFHDMTQSQIAARIGLSQMHVSRLLRSALDQLRHALLADENPPRTTARKDLDIRRLGNGRVAVSIHGNLNRHVAEELRQVLDEALATAPRLVVLDLAQVQTVDNAGLASLAHAHHRSRCSGSRLLLANVHRRLRPALEHVGCPNGPIKNGQPGRLMTRPRFGQQPE